MISRDVIRRCINNDRIAHGLLYQSCAPYVFAIIKNYISDRHFRKDALQEVFAELFSSLSSYNEKKGAFKSWLSKITVHTCIDLQKRKFKVFDDIEDATYENEVLETHIEINESDLKRVELILKDMPEGYKTIFLLNQVEEYSHEKIANLLDIKPETSRSQLNRAKKWIKKNMVTTKNLSPNEVI